MTNLEIVKELYRSFSTKDYESFLSICTLNLNGFRILGFRTVSGSSSRRPMIYERSSHRRQILIKKKEEHQR